MSETPAEQEVLELVLGALEQQGVPYMIVGSFAANFYGQPRYTHDLDLVVEVSAAHVPGLIAALQEKFYVSKEGIERALRTGSMFNAIHNNSVFKVDFWPRKGGAFDLMGFSRRRRVDFGVREAFISTAEDLILRKLLWFKDSGSEKHWTDALNVCIAQASNLDKGYIDKWATDLGIADQWLRLREAAQEREGPA
jgi:hypothetical protein